MMQNGKGRGILFDNAKELAAGRTDEFREQQGIRIILTVIEWSRRTTRHQRHPHHAARLEPPGALLD